MNLNGLTRMKAEDVIVTYSFDISDEEIRKELIKLLDIEQRIFMYFNNQRIKLSEKFIGEHIVLDF